MKYLLLMLALFLPILGCNQKPVPDASPALRATIQSAAESNRNTQAHLNTASTALKQKNFPAATQAVDNASNSSKKTGETLSESELLAKQNEQNVRELERRNNKLADQADDFFSVKQKRLILGATVTLAVLGILSFLIFGRFGFLTKLAFWRKK